LVWGQNFGEPKVCDFYFEKLLVNVFDDEQILRLDVSVYNAATVQVLNDVDELVHNPN
jgi:hypothetical protein